MKMKTSIALTRNEWHAETNWIVHLVNDIL